MNMTEQPQPNEPSPSEPLPSFRSLPGLDEKELAFNQPLPLGPASLLHGTLDNGMRYYVRPVNKPPKRAALALVVAVGSAVEEEEERGIAHILEHLAFNATSEYERHEIVSFLESIGAAFGPCQNAMTSADETIYELLLPTDDEQILTHAVKVFAQFAFRIRCAQADVERERGAVLEEWRSSNDSMGRSSQAHWKLMTKGSRYADRLPIGLESVIRNVKGETVKGFFDRWYRPENMAVVAVGDFPSPERMVALLKEHLGPMRPPVPGPATPVPSFEVPPHTEPLISVFRDAEAGQPELHVSWKERRPALNTPAAFQGSLTRQLLHSILNTRLFKLSRQADDPTFYSAGMDEAPLTKTVQLTTLSASVPDRKDAAPQALETVLTELARIRVHGVSQRELEVAKQETQSDVESIYLERDQAHATAVRDEYVRHFLNDEFVVDPVMEVRLYKTLLHRIAADDVQAVACKLSPSSNCIIKAVGHRRLCSEEQLLAVVRSVERAELAGTIAPWQLDGHAPTEILLGPPAPAGSVTDRRELPALGAVQLTLSNGIKVYHKKTDFLEDQVLMTGFAAGGLLLVPEQHFQSAQVAGSIAGELGAYGHKPEELYDLLAGKRVDVNVSVGPYWRVWGGEQSPQDLETALQLVYNLFTCQLKLRPKEVALCMKIARETVLSSLRNPMRLMSARIVAVNYGTKHYYFAMPSLKKLHQVEPQRACDYWNAGFSNPKEFTVCFTGNISEEVLMPLLERYLAAIPVPQGSPEPLDPANSPQLPLDFPGTSVVERVSAAMVQPQASVRITFPVELPLADGKGREESQWLGLLSRQMETTLMQAMRFDKGGVYSVSVSPGFGLAGPGSKDTLKGEVSVGFTCDPDACDWLVDTAFTAIAGLQEHPITQQAIETLKTLEQRSMESAQHENGYWHDHLVSGLQSKTYQLVGDLDATYLARLESRSKVMDSASPELLLAAFRRLLPYPAKSRYTCVIMQPQANLPVRLLQAVTDVRRPTCWLAAAAVIGAGAFVVSRYWRKR